jgi:hypothetical protein
VSRTARVGLAGPGAVGMYQALPRLSVSSTVCVATGAAVGMNLNQARPLRLLVSFRLPLPWARGPHVARVGRRAVQVEVGRP